MEMNSEWPAAVAMTPPLTTPGSHIFFIWDDGAILPQLYYTQDLPEAKDGQTHTRTHTYKCLHTVNTHTQIHAHID